MDKYVQYPRDIPQAKHYAVISTAKVSVAGFHGDDPSIEHFLSYHSFDDLNELTLWLSAQPSDQRAQMRVLNVQSMKIVEEITLEVV